MPSTSKSSKKARRPRRSRNPEFADAFTPLVLNSVERVANLQKKTLDLAAEQTAEWIGAWKKAFSYFPGSPARVLLRYCRPGRPNRIETQKSAIDLVVEQTEAVTEIAKLRAEAYSKIAESVNRCIPDRRLSARSKPRRRCWSLPARRTRRISKPPRSSSAAAAGPATAILDSFQRGADTVIEAQKSILECRDQAVRERRKKLTLSSSGVRQSRQRKEQLRVCLATVCGCIVVMRGVPMADDTTRNGKPFDPMEPWRGMRDVYLDAWAKTMVDMVNSEAYAQATGAMLDSYLTVSAPFREASKKPCSKRWSSWRCRLGLTLSRLPSA